MIPTRRAAAVLAVGALFTWVTPWPWWFLAGLVAVLALAVLLDAALAGALGDVTLARDGARQLRLGESAEVRLTVTNDGLRPARLRVRDAWVPSAGATPFDHRLFLDPAASADLVTTLTPTRRGDRPAARVTVRSYGPLGLAFRQPLGRTAQARTPAWRLRVLPRFASRRLLPEKLSRLRVIEGLVYPRARPGHRVRHPARVRGRRRRALDRLAGHRPPLRRGGTHLAAGARPAGVLRAGHRAYRGRPGRLTSPGWTPPSTRPCCSPHSPGAPATRWTCSRRTPGYAPA